MIGKIIVGGILSGIGSIFTVIGGRTVAEGYGKIMSRKQQEDAEKLRQLNLR